MYRLISDQCINVTTHVPRKNLELLAIPGYIGGYIDPIQGDTYRLTVIEAQASQKRVEKEFVLICIENRETICICICAFAAFCVSQ